MKNIPSYLLLCALLLTGCGSHSAGPGRPIAAYIQEEVTSAEITHMANGETASWTVEGEALDTLRAWTNDLRYKLTEFAEGNTPGNVDGGEVYDVVLTERDYPGYTDLINGPEGHYLLIEGHWYTTGTDPTASPL